MKEEGGQRHQGHNDMRRERERERDVMMLKSWQIDKRDKRDERERERERILAN